MSSKNVISKEYQELVVTGLTQNSYVLSIVEDQVNDSYFTDNSCKVIYKSLVSYYKKYQKLPTSGELVLEVESNYIDFGTPKSDVQDKVRSIYEEPTVDESFLVDRITELIKKVRVNRSLSKALELIQNGNNLDNEVIATDLVKSLEVSLSKSGVFSLGDLEAIDEARTKAIGDSKNKAVIKSVLPSVNLSLQYRGYQKGTLNLIVSPPGCFVGSTKVLTLDGKSHTLEELYNSEMKGVYGCTKEGKLVTAEYDSIYLSKYTKDLVDVKVNGTVIRCTPDHPFMLRTGEYVRADKLKTGDSLMPIKRGRKSLYSLGKDYEYVVDGNSNEYWTHHLSCDLVEGSGSVRHHIDLNRFNNLPSNMMWVKNSSEHAKLHIKQGDYSEFIEKGKPHRFTSELTRSRNHSNWNSASYRAMMKEVSVNNGKNSELVKRNDNPEVQFNRRKCKVLSYLNSLLKLVPELSVENYEDSRKMLDAKQRPTLLGIAKAYDCAIDVNGNRRYMKVDKDKLTSIWSEVLLEAANYNHKVESVELIELAEEVPVYGIVEAGVNHNYAIEVGEDTGVIVSNTGKTSYLINEGAYAAMQGYRVLHVFLGDMVNYDGFVRYSACISGNLQDDVVKMSSDEVKAMIEDCNNRFSNLMDKIQMLSYGAGEVSIDQLIENVKRIQDKTSTNFDMIVVDYADNLEKDNSNMYNEGGLIYDKLALFARTNNSVLMVASQPKISYWNQEVIPLEGAAESSKKQHVVDMMMTFNLTSRDSKIGTFFIPKVRRGTSGRLIRVETAWQYCRISEISEEDYSVKKAGLTKL